MGVSDSLSPGTVLAGKYRIEKVLGQGGFGITYRAEHQLLNQKVAIKEYFPQGSRRRSSGEVVIPSDMHSSREEFLREGRNLAKLVHPGVVRVTDIIDERGTAYLIMDFVAGSPLLDLSVPISEQQAVGYTRQLLEALKVVHAASLLHFDIKPQNVMLTADGRVVLIDFGAARQFVANRTQTYDVILTHGFAPVEQYSQRGRRGPYTDLYAVSATLYWMITGRVPPRAPERQMGARVAGLDQLSSTMRNVLQRGLELDPRSRTQTADEYLSLLGGGGAVPAHAPVPIPRKPAVAPVVGQGGGLSRLQRARELLVQLSRVNQPPDNRFVCPCCKKGEMVAVTASDNCPECRQATLSLPRPGSSVRCPSCKRGVMEVVEFVPGQLPCPICQKGHLRPPTIASGLRCPACRRANLVNKIPARNKCPLCREDALKAVKHDISACPNCKHGRLHEKSRTKMLVLKDRYIECDDCKAEWTVVGNGWRLDKAQGELSGQIGQVQSPDQWEQASGRSREGYACGNCKAELDNQGDNLRLAWVANPTPMLGKSMPQLAWVKLAYRMQLGRGTHQCPDCQSEFDLDAGQMRVMADPGGLLPHVKEAMPLAAWQRLAAGKQSPAEGYLCDTCQSEWDDLGSNLRLVVVGNGGNRIAPGTVMGKVAITMLARGKTSGKPGAICRTCQAEWDQTAGKYRHLQTGEELSLEGWQARGQGRRHPSMGPSCDACKAEWVVTGNDWELVTAGSQPHRPVGTRLSQADWKLLAAGKESPGDGLKCTSCEAELTLEGGQNYTQTYPNRGATRTLDAWLRIGQDIPDPASASQLQRDANEALLAAVEWGEWRVADDQRSYPGRSKAGEHVLFSIQAAQFKVTAKGASAVGVGNIWITNRRLYVSIGGKNTDISFDKLESIGMLTVDNLSLAEIRRNDRERSLYFILSGFTARMQLGAHSAQADVDGDTLNNILKNLGGMATA